MNPLVIEEICDSPAASVEVATVAPASRMLEDSDLMSVLARLAQAFNVLWNARAARRRPNEPQVRSAFTTSLD
jgi:hypothetical protein